MRKGEGRKKGKKGKENEGRERGRRETGTKGKGNEGRERGGEEKKKFKKGCNKMILF